MYQTAYCTLALLERDGYKFEQGPLLMGDMLEGEPVYEFFGIDKITRNKIK